ncbi:hypothetical protein HY627_01700 [Candidatus Uhrbacteria bacterium]|nr:hypothetical protein [Candidatus Uhrbacteria bacterium]
MKKVLGIAIAFSLVVPTAPVFAKSFVVPHVLEKKQSASVGIKEEGVKKMKQKKFTPGNFKKGVDKATPKLLQKVKSPRDAATGQASGKRQHQPKQFKANLNSSKSNRGGSLNSPKSKTQRKNIGSPRDSASGQASGKRTAQPKAKGNLNSSRSN